MKVCRLEEFRQVLASPPTNFYLLDVRTPAEYEEGHINGAINNPIGQPFADLAKLKDSAVFVYCETHNRSRLAASLLEQAGVNDVTVFDGGMFEWSMNDLPVVN
jgi:rhodanese-related sulfurtransferase